MMNDEDVFFLTGSFALKSVQPAHEPTTNGVALGKQTGSFALKSVQPAHEPTTNGVALGKQTFDMLYFCLFL